MRTARLKRRVSTTMTALLVGGMFTASVAPAHAAEYEGNDNPNIVYPDGYLHPIDSPSSELTGPRLGIDDGNGVEYGEIDANDPAMTFDFGVEESGESVFPGEEEDANASPSVTFEGLNTPWDHTRTIRVEDLPSWTVHVWVRLMAPDGHEANEWVISYWGGHFHTYKLPEYEGGQFKEGLHTWRVYYRRLFGDWHFIGSAQDHVLHGPPMDGGDGEGIDEGTGGGDLGAGDGATGGPVTGGGGSWSGNRPGWTKPGHGRPDGQRPSGKPNHNRPNQNRPVKPSTPAQTTRPAAKHPVTGVDASWLALVGAALTATGGTLAVSRKRR